MRIRLYFCFSCLISMTWRVYLRLISSLCSSLLVAQFPRLICLKIYRMMDLYRSLYGISFLRIKELISVKCWNGLETAQLFHNSFKVFINNGKNNNKDYYHKKSISLCLNQNSKLLSLHRIITQSKSNLCFRLKRYSNLQNNRMK